MLINHTYPIEFNVPLKFRYEEYEPGIGTINYKDRIEPLLPTIWEKLNKNEHSRQAVITLNRPDFMSCLLSLQYQVQNYRLYCIVNLRSQAHQYAPRDSRLICYWTDKVLHNLEYLITEVFIWVNVGNYHTLAERN